MAIIYIAIDPSPLRSIAIIIDLLVLQALNLGYRCRYAYGRHRVIFIYNMYHCNPVLSRSGHKFKLGMATQVPPAPSLAEPDPYAGGEGLVTCYTRSCSGGMQ